MPEQKYKASVADEWRGQFTDVGAAFNLRAGRNAPALSIEAPTVTMHAPVVDSPKM